MTEEQLKTDPNDYWIDLDVLSKSAHHADYVRAAGYVMQKTQYTNIGYILSSYKDEVINYLVQLSEYFESNMTLPADDASDVLVLTILACNAEGMPMNKTEGIEHMTNLFQFIAMESLKRKGMVVLDYTKISMFDYELGRAEPTALGIQYVNEKRKGH